MLCTLTRPRSEQGDVHMAAERRQAARVPALRNEIAILHAADRDIPVQIVNLSLRGVLFKTLGVPFSVANDTAQIELSLHDGESMFQFKARIVRRAEDTVAVEFI